MTLLKQRIHDESACSKVEVTGRRFIYFFYVYSSLSPGLTREVLRKHLPNVCLGFSRKSPPGSPQKPFMTPRQLSKLLCLKGWYFVVVVVFFFKWYHFILGLVDGTREYIFRFPGQEHQLIKP